MALLAKNIYTGDGVETKFVYPTELLTGVAVDAQIKVYVDGVDTAYTVGTGGDEGKVILGTAPANLSSVVVVRETLITSQYVTYTDNSIIDDTVLNQDSDQMFYLIQEQSDRLDDAMLKEPGGGYWEGQGLEVRNAVAGTTSNSLVTVAQMQAAVAGVTVVEADNVTTWTFTGDGSTTDFTLTDAPASLTRPDQLFVYVSGVAQRPDEYDYSVEPPTETTALDFDLDTSGPTPVIQFASAPPVGTDNTLIRVVTGETVASTVADGSVTGDSLADDTVTLDKLIFDTQSPTSRSYFLLVNPNNGQPFVSDISATNIVDFDGSVQTSRLDQMAAPTANVGMGSQKITDLAVGSAGTDAATYGQLTAALSGLTDLKISAGQGTVAGSGTLSVTGLPFTPIAVFLTSEDGGQAYTLMWNASRTWGAWTTTIGGSGFTTTGLTASAAYNYVVVGS